MIRALARLALLLWAVAGVAGLAWTLSQAPFTRPVIDRTDAEIRLALDRALARTVTPGWLLPRLEAAVAAGDADRVALLAGLATDHAIALPEDLRRDTDAVLARHDGLVATGTACLGCMADISSCPSLKLIGACSIPFELTPFGDLNELRRQGQHWWRDEDVDEVAVALAGVGLTATVVALPALGTSWPVKAGATALRVARRAGAVTPGLDRALVRAARAGGAGVGAIAADATRIAGNAGAGEALMLLRLADDPADLARLARLSGAAGADTGKAVAVLGKARSLRLLTRISGLALSAIGLITLVLTQIVAVIAKLLLRRLVRRRPGPA